jgi:class 3 adenylate cyclase/tetratricopeptide (TPR) repeat protein
MVGLQDWLERHGLEKYAAVFATHDITFEQLPHLTESDIDRLALPTGPRRRLIVAIQALSDEIHAQRFVAEAALRHPSNADDAERRQLTVMFCDLVGSTALSQRLDPEELRQLMQAYRKVAGEVVARYKGHVAQYLGDGLMVYFGWPAAHEDDAQRAVHAALEIVPVVKSVKADPPLAVRIGMTTGTVVVGEPSRAGNAEAKLALGETPNLAARLQGLAGQDEVVIGPGTRRLVGAAFELSDIGAHSLKGIAQPVQVWRVDGVHRTEGRFEAAHSGATLTPLIGRKEEVALLLRRWHQAHEGEGQVVLLGGEPGIGKSRILSALRKKLLGQGAAIMSFQCSPYHMNSAFYPAIDNLERALNFGREEDAESKLGKLEALVVQQYGRPRADVRFIAAMLSIAAEHRYGAARMTPQRFKDETLRALVDLIEAAARKQPCLLLYEDAHWADPTSLEVLDLLIDRTRTIPLLLVLTYRPEFRNRWANHGHVSALNLSKLTKSDSATMVSRIAKGKALPGNLFEQIVRKTDGIPLFVEELTTAILESKQIKEMHDRYEYTDAARNVTIPVTLRDSLMARLDRSPPAKEIAKIGAAIGREFSYELIAAVAPHGEAELHSALEQLAESGLVLQRGTPPTATYVFKHALVQDVAYDSSLKTQRKGLHAKIARVFEERFPSTKDTEPELLARHLTAAGDADPAIGYWRDAGNLALRRLALNEAISHLDQGMRLIDSLPRSPRRHEKELELCTLLGTAWVALRGFGASEAWSSFHRALGLAKTLNRHEALLPIYFGLCSNLVLHGRLAEGLDWVNEMLASAEATGDGDLLIMGHRSACTTYFWLGDFNRSREHAHRVLALYNEEKHRHLADLTNVDPKTVVEIYLSIGTWILGYPDRALEVRETMEAHARRRDHPFDIGYALTFGGQVLDFRCEPEALLARVEESDRLGQAHSLPFISDVLSQILRGIAHLRAGRLAECIPQLRGALDKWRAGGALLWMPYLRAVLAEGLALSGDLEGGLSLVEESLAQISQPGWEERSHLAEVLRLRGWMLEQQGKWAAAEETYIASLEVAREQQAKSWELRTATSLVRLWRSQGKSQKARELLASIHGWFTEGFATRDLVEAKALLDEIS